LVIAVLSSREISLNLSYSSVVFYFSPLLGRFPPACRITGINDKAERNEEDTEAEEKSRYLILPSLAHPRQEINREGLSRSSLPFSLALSVPLFSV